MRAGGRAGGRELRPLPTAPSWPPGRTPRARENLEGTGEVTLGLRAHGPPARPEPHTLRGLPQGPAGDPASAARAQPRGACALLERPRLREWEAEAGVSGSPAPRS